MNNPNVIVSSDYGAIIVNRHDPFLGLEISNKGYWAKDDIELIQKLINFQLNKYSNINFFDVGANIGTHTLAIAKIFNDKVSIRAFEAQRFIYYMLCGAVAINGLMNVICENVAVSDANLVEIEIELPNYLRTNNFGGLELIPPARSDNFNMNKLGSQKVITGAFGLTSVCGQSWRRMSQHTNRNTKHNGCFTRSAVKDLQQTR